MSTIYTTKASSLTHNCVFFFLHLTPDLDTFTLFPKSIRIPPIGLSPHIIPPGRPIVSGCNSESAAVEHFIDFFLHPIASSAPSFLRDSTHLIALLTNMNILDTDILFTLDVESLYTNIPISDGIQCIQKALHEHPQRHRPDNYIMKLLEITLTRNDFQFLDQTFLQIKGTAMGKKYAPSFANIYMHFWEQQSLSSFHVTPVFWKRYIDDIFGIWRHSLSDLLAFIQHINSLNPNIKVSISFHSTSIDFLDCTFYKLNNKLATKVFCKPTDSHKLLHPYSFHARHTFTGIVKAQILRYIKLSTQFHDFQHTYHTLKHSLTQMGYKRNLIRYAKREALQLSACNTDTTIMITGCKPCSQPRCQTCQHMNTTRTISSNKSDIFLITQNTSCSTHNCIYAIHCSLCSHIPTLYIGETQNSCRDRISKHKYDIKHNADKPVSTHFNLPNHSINNLKVTVIQFLQTHSKVADKIPHHRKLKEVSWIKKLQTFSPHGLNNNTLLHTADIPLTLLFSKSATNLSRVIKSKLAEEDSLRPFINFIPAYSNNPNLHKLLAPTRLK